MFSEYAPNSTDLNSWTTPGMYVVGNSFPNAPADWLIVIVFGAADYRLQLAHSAVYTNKHMFARVSADAGSSWSDWETYSPN